MWKTVVFLGPLTIGVLSCSMAQKKQRDENREYYVFFKSKYDPLWQALQRTLFDYPLSQSDAESGFIQTFAVKGEDRYRPAHKRKEFLPNGYRYKLTVRAVKKGKGIQVSVLKEPMLLGDFFSDPRSLVSKGYEERWLLYRLGRELVVGKMMERAIKNEKESSQ